MGLFTEYRFAEIEGKKIVVLAKAADQGANFEFYVDGVLMHTYGMGVGDNHTFQDGNLKVEVQQKALKTVYKAYFNDKEYQLPKAKKKDLIASGALPIPEKVEYKIDPKALILPVVGLLVGAFLYDYLGSATRSSKIISGVVLVASGYLLAGVLLPKSGMLAGSNRGKLKLLSGIVSMVLITMLVDKLSYGTTDKGDLYGQLSTDSPSVKIPVKTVEYNEAVRIKRRDYPASWSHLYEFTIGGETFKGSYNSSVKSYEQGDSIAVYYLAKDPRINKHLTFNDN